MLLHLPWKPHSACGHGLQLFGCVDWAPSDLIATFLLAGAAQTCRRRSKVEIIAAAGGVPAAAPRPSPIRDGNIHLTAPCRVHLFLNCMTWSLRNSTPFHCTAGQMLVPASRAASLHSASSADMMLAEGFLDMPPYDVEAGAGIQPLVTPSGMGIEMRCAPYQPGGPSRHWNLIFCDGCG